MMPAQNAAAAIALLGGPASDAVVDFALDPGAACRAVDALPEHGGFVVRVTPEPRVAAVGYGPVPVDPMWIRIQRGAREVGTALYRGGEGAVRRAARVVVDVRDERCCDAPGCDRARTIAAVWLVLDADRERGEAERVLVAEPQGRGDGGVRLGRAIARRLATAIDVPCEGGGDAPGDDEVPPPLGEPLPVAELARFSLGSEGDRAVLRDWDSLGPRATARRNAGIGAGLALIAAALWASFAGAVRGQGSAVALGTAVALGAAATLATLAAYAFIGVARFSAKYRARSSPLAALGRDRVVVLPWVGRDGALDLRPEGRLGAAIPLVEVRAAHARPRPRGFGVELDTDHGPIDVMVCATEAGALLWSEALTRAVDEARHPRAGASARQRARAKQAATA